MAKPSWLSTNKNSGSGVAPNFEDTVIASASVHTGRVQRTGTLTFTAGNCDDVVCTVNQTGKTEFVTIQSAASVAKGGVETLTITGTSNSSKLTFSFGSNAIGLTLPANYTAGGSQATSGTAISGDPGASNQYEFSITFTNIGENTTINAKTTQLIVTANGGQTATCTVTQAEGDAYLTVSPASITLAADGSETGTFTVSTNTSYAVS